MSKKFYITTPIYYVNDKPHIGHAYTTLAADVLARYHRLMGNDVFFLTGTDEHGAKVAKSAENVGKKPQEFCNEMSAYFSSTWDALNISNDNFIRTTSNKHKKGVEKFLMNLQKNNAIYEDKYQGLYCIGCEKFITEKELVDGKCPDHQIKPEKISEKNYFFKLSNYLTKVRELIKRDEINILPEHAKKETLGLFEQGLEDFSVSREKVKWGVKLPFDEKQTVYVWVEALQNYITALGFGGDEKKFNKYWPADLHIIGKDILKFHAIYWPAMLLAAGMKLPKAVFAHGFFTIDGQKMSKTLGNVIDPNKLVKEYGADGARFLIISQFPFGSDGDIKAEKFVEQYNAKLADNLGNLVSRVINLAFKIEKSEKEYDEEIKNQIEKAWNNYEKTMDEFRIDKALDQVMKLINFANKYIDKTKPWEEKKNDQDRFIMLMNSFSELVRHLGWQLRPFIPETSDKILKQLGVLEIEKEWELKEIKKWREVDFEKIKKGEVLFPKS